MTVLVQLPGQPPAVAVDAMREFFDRAWDTLLWVERDPEADSDMHVGLCESLTSALSLIEELSPELKIISLLAYEKADRENPAPEPDEENE